MFRFRRRDWSVARHAGFGCEYEGQVAYIEGITNVGGSSATMVGKGGNEMDPPVVPRREGEKKSNRGMDRERKRGILRGGKQ